MSLKDPEIREIYESNPQVFRVLAESLPLPVDTETLSKKIISINDIFLERDLKEKDERAKEEKIKEYVLEKKPSLPLFLNYVASYASAK